MAADRKDPPPNGEAVTPGSAIPNRDRRRDPPVIDAKPEEVREIATGEPGKAAGPAAAAEIKSGPRSNDAPAPDREGKEAPSRTAPKPEARDKDPHDKDSQGKDSQAESSISTDAPGKGAPAAETPPRPGAAAKPQAKQSEPAQRAPRRAGAFLPGLLAGAIGAGLVAAGAYALVAPRLYSAAQIDALLASGSVKAAADLNAAIASAQKGANEETARQHALIDDLTRRVAAAEAQSKAVFGEIDRLRADVSKPAASQPPAPAVDLGPIEAGLGELEKRIEAIEAALRAPKTTVRAGDPDAKPPEGQGMRAAPEATTDLSALAERLRALESRPAPRVPDLAPSLAPVQSRLQAIEQRLGPLLERIGPLESALAQSREAAGAQAKSVETGRQRADAAALTVVARVLSDAVAAGGPFSNLLKAAQALGADADAIKTLEPLAGKGLPPGASLLAQFGPISAAILDSANRPAPNATLTEKLSASAAKLVRLQPAEDTTEETLPALVTRIGAALRAQNYPQALALYDQLPEAARAPSKSWAQALRLRVEAGRAADRIFDGALARLQRP